GVRTKRRRVVVDGGAAGGAGNATTGGWGGEETKCGGSARRTVTTCDVVDRAPRSSTTCRRTLWSPALLNDVRTTVPWASSYLPSPSRSHLALSIDPSESCETEVK